MKVFQMQSSKKYRINVPKSQVSYEKGAVLIVVLLFLIMIALAGTLAVRQSSTDLRVATSDQVNTLMLQSSDSANQQLEGIINGDPTNQIYKDILSRAGMFGYYILDPDSRINEYIYCFNGKEDKYLERNSTVRQPDGGTLFSKGYCNFKDPKGYTSNRQTLVTQVSLIPSSAISKENEPFGTHVIGKDVNSSSSKKYRFDIRSTSTIPSYSKKLPEGCFNKTSVDKYASSTGDKTLMECLRNKQTPAKVLYQQADLANSSRSTKCTPFGVGSGSLAQGCVLSP